MRRPVELPSPHGRVAHHLQSIDAQPPALRTANRLKRQTNLPPHVSCGLNLTRMVQVPRCTVSSRWLSSATLKVT